MTIVKILLNGFVIMLLPCRKIILQGGAFANTVKEDAMQLSSQITEKYKAWLESIKLLEYENYLQKQHAFLHSLLEETSDQILLSNESSCFEAMRKNIIKALGSSIAHSFTDKENEFLLHSNYLLKDQHDEQLMLAINPYRTEQPSNHSLREYVTSIREKYIKIRVLRLTEEKHCFKTLDKFKYNISKNIDAHGAYAIDKFTEKNRPKLKKFLQTTMTLPNNKASEHYKQAALDVLRDNMQRQQQKLSCCGCFSIWRSSQLRTRISKLKRLNKNLEQQQTTCEILATLEQCRVAVSHHTNLMMRIFSKQPTESEKAIKQETQKFKFGYAAPYCKSNVVGEVNRNIFQPLYAGYKR